MISRLRTTALVLGIVLLAILPPVAIALDEPFYIDLFRRIMIFAIAALSLNLIDRKSTRLNSSHSQQSRMPSSA